MKNVKLTFSGMILLVAMTMNCLAQKKNPQFENEQEIMASSDSVSYAMSSEFHIPTTVFEIAQSAIENGPYLTFDDYKSYGEGMVRAIQDYFNTGGNVE
jgi:hypothetical protein